ncbi:UDP-N-acetylmuramate--L-alanine ligase [Spongisporangium articulatum]|uniref:UDP-N-acetylmuramate--L-alanine ligase n=1 Tax=Spongisporangium articulatum TaxID=3362603 RepID=A0ABW8ATJ7_9ACTN
MSAVLDGPFHLIGVGGAGMSGIALLLADRGLATSGSDGRDSAVLQTLRDAGVRVFVGHAAEQVPAGSTVVVSSAVKEDNPELAAARAAGLSVLHRSEALAALMADRRGVAVAGTHGKTSTTGMVTVVLRECGLDPSFAIGGQLTDSGVGAHAGAGEAFVAEADESDGSFLRYRPEVAVITNVEADHLDHYGTAEAVDAAFVEFCRTVRAGGLVVACGDDPGVRRVLEAVGPELAARGVQVSRYGYEPGLGNDVLLTAADPLGIEGVGSVRLQVPGRHMALNAAAAWRVAVHLGAEPAEALQALAAFAGTKRRFELRGTARGIRVFDDYAHHPTEIRALLAAARPVAGDGRLVVVFQPHLPSRTRAFAREFGEALSAADEVVVLDVYAAREAPDPQVNGALVAGYVTGVATHADVPASAVPDLVAGLTKPGDVVLTVGAGDVTELGPLILDALAEPAATR